MYGDVGAFNPMVITIRPAVSEDADAIARTFLESAEYHAPLDPERYLIPALETIVARYREGRQHPANELGEGITLVRNSVGRSLDSSMFGSKRRRIRCIEEFSTATLPRLQSATDTRGKESADYCYEQLKSGGGNTAHILGRWSTTSQTHVRASFIRIVGTPSQLR